MACCEFPELSQRPSRLAARPPPSSWPVERPASFETLCGRSRCPIGRPTVSFREPSSTPACRPPSSRSPNQVSREAPFRALSTSRSIIAPIPTDVHDLFSHPFHCQWRPRRMSPPAKLRSLSGEPSPRDSLVRAPTNSQPRSTGACPARNRDQAGRQGGAPEPCSRQEANREIGNTNREGVQGPQRP